MTKDAAALRAQARERRGAGDAAGAAAFEREAAALLLAAGDRAGHAHALRHAADILSEAGDPAAAAPLYAEALGHYAESASVDAANALRGAAVNAERLGEREQALALWRRARDAYAANHAWFVERAGGNPGAAEAEARIAALSASG